MIFSKKKGFTLIELLVVIAIIGLLASIVLVNLNRARKKARDAKKIATLKQVQNAIELYYSDYNYYPNVSQGGSCGSQTCNNGDGWETLKTILQNEGLLSDLPSKDEGYIYCSDKTSNSQEYVLGNTLETNHQILNDAVDFDGIFFSDWGCDDINCSGYNFCLVHCENISGQEGPGNASQYPPNCGTY